MDAKNKIHEILWKKRKIIVSGETDDSLVIG